jgi:hypothetical protein
LIADLKDLPYKRDVFGIGCNSMEIIENYLGMLKDLKKDKEG